MACTGAPALSSAVPESLFAELHSVSERVQRVVAAESQKLALERVALEVDKSKQAERLEEQAVLARRDNHALAAVRLELKQAADQAAAVNSYQHQRICLMVGSTPFTAAAPTLCERAPNSALALLVKRQLDEQEHAHELGGSESAPLEIFIDREPSVIHWLLQPHVEIAWTNGSATARHPCLLRLAQLALGDTADSGGPVVLLIAL